MKPLKKDLVIRKGILFEHAYAWLQGIEKTPKPLTGWKGLFKVRPNLLSETVLLELSTENGGILIDEPNGRFTFKLPAAQTAIIDWDFGEYDFRFIRPDGEPILFMEGRIDVKLTNSR